MRAARVADLASHRQSPAQSAHVSGPDRNHRQAAGAEGAGRKPLAVNQTTPESPATKRVIVVDDSATGRALIRRALTAEPRLTIVGEAADPIEARQMIRLLAPDVLVLDIEMPQMNGLEFLRRLMRLRPMPAVMLSGLTRKGSALAIEALAAGAVVCLEKTAHLFAPDNPTLARHVLTAADAMPTGRMLSQTATACRRPYLSNGKLVLIGASTGGVDALERLFRHWPSHGPPVLVAQHMPAHYLTRFVARLDGLMAPQVAIATEGRLPGPGQIWFAPGGAQHLALRPGTIGPVCRLEMRAGMQGHCPSVARLFGSALPWAAGVIAAMLTGMGSDGAAEMAELRGRGARTLAQDRASSTVYGMPGAAVKLGAAEQILSLDRIAETLLELGGGWQAA